MINAYIISCNNDRYQEFCRRVPACIGQLKRINRTPENTVKPDWFKAKADRWALTAAYIDALEEAKAQGSDALLFEDDCVFVPDFETRYNEFMEGLPDDWDFAYLGGQLLAAKMYPPKAVEGFNAVLDGRFVHRTHAWALRHKAIDAVLSAWNNPSYPGICTCDWILGYLHLQANIHVYIPASGWLCGQGENESALTCKREPERWWHFTEPELQNEIERINAFCSASTNEVNNDDVPCRPND